jgi:MerR family transcriptional regulator, light-induced transcriptional regulator
MEELLSPKQVARAMGVSESSLKRWCDRGLIPTIRTAGGHRKLPVAAVLSFLRQNCKQLVRPEVLGLPPVCGTGEITFERASDAILAALRVGDADAARRTIFDLYLAGNSAVKLCDNVLANVFHQIGSGWQCGELQVYQERRACEIVLRLLHELNLALPATPPNAPLAIGGTLAGDCYQIPTAMVELVLREQGWQAQSFGSNLPLATWQAALLEQRPQLMWLSVSYIADVELFVEQFQQLAELAQQHKIPLIIGGRELPTEIRKRLTFTAYYDNFTQMLNFTSTLLHR